MTCPGDTTWKRLFYLGMIFILIGLGVLAVVIWAIIKLVLSFT